MKKFFATSEILEVLAENGIILTCSDDITLPVTDQQEREITDTLNNLGIESDWGFED